MRTLNKAAMLIGVGVLIGALFGPANLFVPLAGAAGDCGCMDVALVIDNSGSMGGAVSQIKVGLTNDIIAAAAYASGLDLRIGLITTPSSNVVVNVPLTNYAETVVSDAIESLDVASDGEGTGDHAECTDEALQYVITGAVEPSCTASNVYVLNGPLSAFRTGCAKVVILVTDALPGGCDDTFATGVDDIHARSVAKLAAESNVVISTVYVPTSTENADIKNIMIDYADYSGGSFIETASDGTGVSASISNIIARCSSEQCITRPARFWFTHGTGTDVDCVSLMSAIETNWGVLNLGFTRLPTASYVDGDSTNSLMEALGFYWRGIGRTGEDGGTQNAKLRSAVLCRARKLLIDELIPAVANVRLLGTRPSNCTYNNGGTTTNFPDNLVEQARLVAAGEDIAECQAMTKLLKKFNNSGITNNFLGSAMECDSTATRTLKKISRDPTERDTCPGINDSCITAEAVNNESVDPYAFLFKRSVNTSVYDSSSVSDDVASNTFSGYLVWYKITPEVGTSKRHFTASTAGSNYDTTLSVWQGICSSTTNSMSMVTNNDNYGGTWQSRVGFKTDGTNTYYIVVGGSGYGRAKIKVTN